MTWIDKLPQAAQAKIHALQWERAEAVRMAGVELTTQAARDIVARCNAEIEKIWEVGA